MRAEILMFDGADELDVVGPYAVLRRAAARAEDWRVRLVVAPGRSREVTLAGGLRALADGEMAPQADLLVVPGGGWAAGATSGVPAEVADGTVPRLVMERHRGGAVVASVCTGAVILAAGGLLSRRPATTHRSAMAALADAGAHVVAERVVDDGDVVTAGGVTSGIDLALWLVERMLGRDAAEAIALQIEHRGAGAVFVASAR